MPSNGTMTGWAVALGLALPVGLAGDGRADVVKIRGGATLHGAVVPIEGRPGHVEVYTATAARPFVFRSDQIEQIVHEETPLVEYLRRRDAVEETAEAHYRLGLWCEERGLTGPASVHHRRAVELDEDHDGAQQKLGRVFFDGRWMTYDERRELQGLVRHGGRWITPEEKEDIEAQQRMTASQEAWARRIDLLVKKFTEGSPIERDEAQQQLGQINDPEAVVPLVNRLGRQGTELRVMLAHLLGGIDDPKAASGLVHRVVREEDPQVRLSTLNELARRREPQIVPSLIRELQKPDPEHVGRAAWALAGLGATEAVPKLIPALVSVQKRVETVLVPAPAPASGGGLGLGVSFGTTVGPAFGVGGGPTIPVLTGPAVAPGAIAFGAQAVPVLGYVGQGAGVATVGGAVPQAAPPPPVPRQVVRPYEHRNVEVLAALERLTGKNFGFDVTAWNRWLRDEYRPPAEQRRPARLVPQP